MRRGLAICCQTAVASVRCALPKEDQNQSTSNKSFISATAIAANTCITNQIFRARALTYDRWLYNTRLIGWTIIALLFTPSCDCSETYIWSTRVLLNGATSGELQTLSSTTISCLFCGSSLSFIGDEAGDMPFGTSHRW